jgi:hypothetical protein
LASLKTPKRGKRSMGFLAGKYQYFVYASGTVVDMAIRKIFPHTFVETRIPIKGSALARIKQRHRELAAQGADPLGEEHVPR